MDTMEDILLGGLAIFGIFILPVIVGGRLLFLLIKTRNEERMESLKLGIIPQSQTKASPNKLVALRNGCLSIGLALGIIAGLIANSLLILDDINSFLVLLASSALFIGVAYVVYFFLVRNKESEE